MKVCTKCGNPLVPPSENHCENCWYGQYTQGDNYRMPFYHQEIKRFVPKSEEKINEDKKDAKQN